MLRRLAMLTKSRVRQQAIGKGCNTASLLRPYLSTMHHTRLKNPSSSVRPTENRDTLPDDFGRLINRGDKDSVVLSAERQTNPIGGHRVSIENLQAFLSRNGLPETIEMLHATAPESFGTNETEAFDKMKLILRILEMPADTAGTLIGLIEELAPNGKPLRM